MSNAKQRRGYESQTARPRHARYVHGGIYSDQPQRYDFFLNRTEYRVYRLLTQGGQYATFDIAQRLNIPDPRSTIRYLRKMGISVSDYWVIENKMRFKRYFIRGGGAVC